MINLPHKTISLKAEDQNGLGAQLGLTFKNVPLVTTTLTQEKTPLPFAAFGEPLLMSALLRYRQYPEIAFSELANPSSSCQGDWILNR